MGMGGKRNEGRTRERRPHRLCVVLRRTLTCEDTATSEVVYVVGRGVESDLKAVRWQLW